MADAEVSLKHLFQSQKADGADTTKVRATPWNANHPFTGGVIGDLLYYDSASTTGAKWLPDVAVNQVLVSGGVGVKPAWSASPSLTSLTLATPLAVASGGNGFATGTTGDILHFSGSGVIGKLADVAAGSLLASGGVGGVPAWTAAPTVTSLKVGTATAVSTATLTIAGGSVGFLNDNTDDVGMTGRRPSVVRAATAVEAGGSPAATGAVRMANGVAGLRARNAANGADISLLAADSSDVVTLGDNSFNTIIKGATIKWNIALIALGGGSAPTLGTIGGSGPATAGQNTWFKFTDSTGASAYMPVWK